MSHPGLFVYFYSYKNNFIEKIEDSTICTPTVWVEGEQSGHLTTTTVVQSFIV